MRAPASFATLLILCAAFTNLSAAERRAHPDDGRILEERPYSFPAYDSLSAGQRRELSRTTTAEPYEAMRAVGEGSFRKVIYGSDGLRVVAYVLTPRRAAEGPRPVIVYSRGSWVADDLAPTLLPLMHRLAGMGYTVVAPMYRGSDGGEGRDELGGDDLADVINAIRLAARLPGADSGRVFLYGESRGGMMTLQALREGAPVRAAAVVGAFTDMDSLLAGDPRSRGAARTIWPDLEARRAEIVARRSAVTWSDSIRTPLLILHGGADRQVSPRHALRLALLLDAAGATYDLHILHGGSHTLAERAAMRDSLVTEWFARHAP